jgi:photosystem II stability/assembly factor-like uncharacterized protein
MRTIILFFCVLASTQSFAQSGWVLQKSETTDNLLSISTFDGINAVAVGERGSVTTTDNEGRPTWNRQQSFIASSLNGVTSVSAKILLAVGPKDSVYRSVDRGVTWSGVRSRVRGECYTLDNIHQLNSIDFDSADRICVAVGDQFEVIFSDDSGKTWEERLPPLVPSAFPDLRCVSVYGGTVLSAGTTQPEAGISQLLTSTNQGDDWLTTTTNMPGISPINSGHFFFGCDTKAWITVGDKGSIYHSKNKGLTWDSIPSWTTENLNAVRFAPDSLNGFIAGDGGVILATRDGGYNWSREFPPTKHNLHGVALVDPFHVYICGDSGIILWTQDGGFSGVRSTGGDIEMHIQTYPNPLSSKTTIQVFLHQSRQVNLRIFNTLGVEVTTIANSLYDQGLHSFEWNVGDSPNGIYICRLESGGQSIFSKMVVAR